MSRTIGFGLGATPWGNEELEPEAYRARRQILRHRQERGQNARLLGIPHWQGAILDEAFTFQADEFTARVREVLNMSLNGRVK